MTYLIENDAGKYRNHSEGVFDGEKVIFVAPPENLVPSLMHDLFDWLKNDSDTHILIKSDVLSLTERKTRMGFLIKVKNKEANTTVRAFRKLIGNELKPILKSITFDNGSEFYAVKNLEDKIIKIYFAHSYSARERGTNENYNGIVR